MNNINNKALFTIASKNYISFARTLLASVLKHNDGIDLYLLIGDEIDNYFDKSKENFTVIEARELDLDNYERIAFKYNIVEFNTALKPIFINYLLKRGYNKIIYLDPDIMVFNSLDFLYKLLDRHSIVLTPHLTRPLSSSEQCFPPENMFLLAGAFNLGFIGVSNNNETEGIIDWWSRKCSTDCFNDYYNTGRFVDQKWCTLFSGFSDSIHIVRHLGCNMAVWNLHERRLNSFIVNESVSLIFYHFSGFNPDEKSSITRNQTIYTLENRADLRNIFDEYTNRVFSNGYSETKNWPYKYATFANGVPITPIARQLFPFVESTYADPFTIAKSSYYSLLIKKRLLTSGGNHTNNIVKSHSNVQKKHKMLLDIVFEKIFKLLSKLLGPKRYFYLIDYLQKVSSIRKHEYLLK